MRPPNTVVLFFVSGIVGVQIHEMRVPSAVESGSQPHVILDCDYDLSETESSQVDVKWYFRDDPQPFFQVLYTLEQSQK